MDFEFDVIKEPCVPVRMKSGEFLDLSIRDVFLKAHEILSVSTENYFEEFGIKRLLSCMFMDWVRPKDDEELEDLYSIGAFDITSFDKYIEECEKESDVFNLFSKETPFLQTKYNNELDKSDKILGIENLFYDLPSSTNHIFFYKKYPKVLPKDAFRGLTAINLFLYGSGGGGHCGGVNGDSPYYIWIKGNNLFQEIILNSISIETLKDNTNDLIPYSNGIGESVIWRRKSEIKIQNPFENISLLEGMTFMGRRLTLFIDKEGYVNKVSINHASKFLNSNNAWRDPHCCYFYREIKNKETNKKIYGKVPKKPNDSDYIWMNEDFLYNFDKQYKPLTFLKFGDFNSMDDANIKRRLKYFELNNLDIIIYGGWNQRGLYKWYVKKEIKLDYRILDNKAYSERFVECLNLIQVVGSEIKSSLVLTISKDNFYNKSQQYINTIFIENLLNSNLTVEESVKIFKKEILKYAIETYQNELEMFNFNKKLEFKVKKNSKHNKIVNSYELYYLELYSMIAEIEKHLGMEKRKRKKKKEKINE